MAAVNGIKGAISFAGQSDLVAGQANALLANKWSGSYDRDVHDVTPFLPDGNARVHVGGLHSFSGTMEGFLDGSTAPSMTHMTNDEVPAEFILTAHSGNTKKFTFNGIMSNFSPSVDAQGVNTWSASFTSSGPVTEA